MSKVGYLSAWEEWLHVWGAIGYVHAQRHVHRDDGYVMWWA